MRNPPITRPDDATRAWVTSVTGAERVVSARRLVGGLTSAVHLVTVVDRRGARDRVVLRRYTQPENDWTTGAIEQEADTLRQLERTSIAAPVLIAADATGEATNGVPAILMSRVPGRGDLHPADPERFVREMATRLAQIHDAPVVARAFDRAVVPNEDRIAEGTTDRSLWVRAAAVMRGPKQSYDSRFLHRDYQHFNMLWSRGRLTGVVDWPFASMGPREIDSGHCRLNLAVLFSAELAERFRLAYESEAGVTTDPWWDVHAIWSFTDVWLEFIPQQVAGRTTVDLGGMCRRVDELLAAALSRLDKN